jgi:hypothetical protein
MRFFGDLVAERFLAAPIAAPETAPMTVPTRGTPSAVPATAPATAPPNARFAVLPFAVRVVLLFLSTFEFLFMQVHAASER